MLTKILKTRWRQLEVHCIAFFVCEAFQAAVAMWIVTNKMRCRHGETVVVRNCVCQQCTRCEPDGIHFVLVPKQRTQEHYQPQKINCYVSRSLQQLDT